MCDIMLAVMLCVLRRNEWRSIFSLKFVIFLSVSVFTSVDQKKHSSRVIKFAQKTFSRRTLTPIGFRDAIAATEGKGELYVPGGV